MPTDFQTTVIFPSPGAIPGGLNLLPGLRLINMITGEEFCVEEVTVPSIPIP